jgi:hypothetical protein
LSYYSVIALGTSILFLGPETTGWKVGAARDLTILERGSWDGAAAGARIFSWAGWDDNPDPAKARKGFLLYDADAPELKGSYKLPFADVVDGELTPPPVTGHDPFRTVDGKTYYLPFDYNLVSQSRQGG